ncbi:MAG: hypothetical protein ACLGQU_11485 [Acidobacteriota bacterium]
MTRAQNQYVFIAVLAACAVGVCRSEEPQTQGVLGASYGKQPQPNEEICYQSANLAAYFDQRSKEFGQKAQDEHSHLDQLDAARYRTKYDYVIVDHVRAIYAYDRSQAKKWAEKAAVLQLKAEAVASKLSSSANGAK